MDFFVHESSYVDEGAQIGAGTKIWHFCHIMGSAKIGERCNIGQNVFVAADVTIGNNVKIQNNVSLYTGVVVEDDVFLGPSMVLTNVINPRSHVSRKDEYKSTLIKQGASVGANATIVCGVTLGRYCFVGAGTVVTRSVPDFGLVYGNPGRVQGWMCQCGVRLGFEMSDGQEQAFCAECGARYIKKGQIVTPLQKYNGNGVTLLGKEAQ
jgi:UDP-2-acetamido-3-amino-2,3-dideoxy-glucuronate N-acetyltransferase